MLTPMTAQIIREFFAWAPLTIFVLLLITLYLATRRRAPARVAIGKTYACAQCGRRGRRDHMVPVSEEGGVVWYCPRCASSAVSRRKEAVQ